MWKRIDKEQIKQVNIGDKIRVNGVETTLARHYSDCDFGFDTEDVIPYGNGYFDTFGSNRWNNVVEVWADCEPTSSVSSENKLINTLFDQEYPDYEHAVTNEVFIDFIENHVSCGHHIFMDKLIEIMTHDQKKELVKEIFHLQTVE